MAGAAVLGRQKANRIRLVSFTRSGVGGRRFDGRGRHLDLEVLRDTRLIRVETKSNDFWICLVGYECLVSQDVPLSWDKRILTSYFFNMEKTGTIVIGSLFFLSMI